MKLIIRIILIAGISYFLSFFTPWWNIVIVSFIVSMIIYGHSFSIFLSGFLGGGVLWLIYAWYLDIKSDSILTNKITQLFPFDDPLLLIIISGLIGGLTSAFGALSGNSFRLIFVKKKSKSLYN